MNAVVDIGNSTIKIGLFLGESLTKIYIKKDKSEAAEVINNIKPENLITSSVSIHSRELLEALNYPLKHSIAFSPTTPIPVNNKYKQPESLGADRLAGAVGAVGIFPKENCLIIDAGSCITYDIIDSLGNYLGGSISPGIYMKFKALNNFTARLPLIEPEGEPELIGTTTKNSILSGVLNGTLSEVQGMIGQYSQNFNDLKIIICGGDAKFFETRIKGTIFVIPELVLIGLNRILQHNVSG